MRLRYIFARVWTRMESFGKMTGKGLDFSEPTQKKIMDRSEMKKKKYLFPGIQNNR